MIDGASKKWEHILWGGVDVTASELVDSEFFQRSVCSRFHTQNLGNGAKWWNLKIGVWRLNLWKTIGLGLVSIIETDWFNPDSFVIGNMDTGSSLPVSLAVGALLV